MNDNFMRYYNCSEEDLENDRRIIRDLKFSYRIGVSFICIIYILVYFTLGSMIDGQRGFAKIINVAGRQRMLSQRIALLATDLKYGNSASQRSLLDSLTLMERSQNALINGDDLDIRRALSASVRQVYFEGLEPLDPLVREFLMVGRRFASNSTATDSVYSFNHLDTSKNLAISDLM